MGDYGEGEIEAERGERIAVLLQFLGHMKNECGVASQSYKIEMMVSAKKYPVYIYSCGKINAQLRLFPLAHLNTLF